MSRDKNILVDVWLVASLADRLVARVLDDSPLSVDEFAVYGLVADLAPITSAELVRATGRSPTTISTLVRRCEARGELVRTPDPDDARASFLELTAAGRDAHAAVVPRLVAEIEAIAEGLGAHHDEVRASLADLDGVLRRRLGVGARPYGVSGPPEASVLAYSGEPLDRRREREVLQFIEWLRFRDA